VNDAQAVHLDDVNRIFAALHAHHVVVVGRDRLDMHVVDLLVDGVPVVFLDGALAAVVDEHFLVVPVLNDVELGGVVVQVRGEDDVGLDAGNAAELGDGVGVDDDASPLGGLDLEKRLAVPDNLDLGRRLFIAGQSRGGRQQAGDDGSGGKGALHGVN